MCSNHIKNTIPDLAWLVNCLRCRERAFDKTMKRLRRRRSLKSEGNKTKANKFNKKVKHESEKAEAKGKWVKKLLLNGSKLEANTR